MCAATASITATATAIAASTAAPTTPVTASDANSKVNFKKFCGHVYWLTTDALENIDSIKDIYLIILHNTCTDLNILISNAMPWNHCFHNIFVMKY